MAKTTLSNYPFYVYYGKKTFKIFGNKIRIFWLYPKWHRELSSFDWLTGACLLSQDDRDSYYDYDYDYCYEYDCSIKLRQRGTLHTLLMFIICFAQDRWRHPIDRP